MGATSVDPWWRKPTLLAYFCSHILVAERAPETWVSSIRSITMEKWVGGKFNKAFLHFLPNFAIFDGVSKVERTKGAAELWKIIIYGKNLAKNKEKMCSTCLQPIIWLILGTRKSNFKYSFCHYWWWCCCCCPLNNKSHDDADKAQWAKMRKNVCYFKD